MAMRKTVWFALLFVALFVTASACARQGDAYGNLPAFAFRSEAALAGYKTALDHKGLLKRLPCYCGCGQDPQYISLADCFFSPEGYNSHAANCAVCLEEAEDAATWRNEGMALPQIRQAVDDKYGERGPATKTPPIASGEEISE